MFTSYGQWQTDRDRQTIKQLSGNRNGCCWSPHLVCLYCWDFDCSTPPIHTTAASGKLDFKQLVLFEDINWATFELSRVMGISKRQYLLTQFRSRPDPLVSCKQKESIMTVVVDKKDIPMHWIIFSCYSFFIVSNHRVGGFLTPV